MQHAVNADAGHGGTGDRGQERATQGVAQRVAESGFEGRDREARAVVRYNFFTQGGALCNEH